MTEPTTIKMYGTNWCQDCKRAKKFFGEHPRNSSSARPARAPRPRWWSASTCAASTKNGRPLMPSSEASLAWPRHPEPGPGFQQRMESANPVRPRRCI